jgi:hypothetical protein
LCRGFRDGRRGKTFWRERLGERQIEETLTTWGVHYWRPVWTKDGVATYIKKEIAKQHFQGDGHRHWGCFGAWPVPKVRAMDVTDDDPLRECFSQAFMLREEGESVAQVRKNGLMIFRQFIESSDEDVLLKVPDVPF